MNKFLVNGWLAIFFMLCATTLSAQHLYDLNTIQKIEITFTQPDWDYQMDTAKYGAEDYLMASEVKINGLVYDSVGVKYKGNSSFDSTFLKNPLHIEMDAFKDQKHLGFTDIKLSNGYGDPSMIREVLAYQILGNYMHCPRSNFAQVYINGNYIGLYSSAENIDKKFCADHFYSSQNTFVKCNPIVNPGPTTKSNLKYINTDSSSYSLYYEIKSKTGWNELVKLCDSVSNNTGSLDNMLDMDRIIWMLAFNNVLINLDSYSGVFAQNHYTYRDQTGHYNPIVWDLNMAFGAFPFAGAGSTSMGSLTIPGMQQFPSDNHATDTNWPLINAVHNNSTYKKKYIAHMRTILEEFFANNLYETLAAQLHTTVDTAVQSDTHTFFSYTQFQQAMDSLTDVGSYDVPGIKTLMNARVTYLQSSSEFTAVAPTITSVTSSVATPAFNSAFILTASITNANSNGVTLGYRFDKTQKFQKTAMYDDGLHNDGAANDNVFGANLTMTAGVMYYYIYAENNNAGIFSPQRAEHEFHTLLAGTQTPSVGQLVINEVLADNVDNLKDEYNESGDWIELFNNSGQLLTLSDLYLSDNPLNLMKWKFPVNTTLNPLSFLTIWADNDSLEQLLHTNFNLNKDSGILLLSNGAGLILDSISFSNQVSDISFGRYPNGTGSFVTMNTTYGYVNNNYPLSASSTSIATSCNLFPNPASESVLLTFDGEQPISVYTLTGQEIYRSHGSGQHRISTSTWANGLYLVKCGKDISKLSIHQERR